MEKKEMLYEGKAKKVFATDDPEVLLVSYKDDATAFNGLKKGTISGKGAINNRVTNYMMQILEKEGVPTHFVEELSDRDTLVKKVTIVPLEVIIRNISAGSFASTLQWAFPSYSWHDESGCDGHVFPRSYVACRVYSAFAERLARLSLARGHL